MARAIRTGSSRGASVLAEDRSGLQIDLPFKAWLAWIGKHSGAVLLCLALILLASFRAQIVAAFDHDISSINVHGDFTHLDPADVEQVTKVWLGESFLMADLEEIKAKVEALPWVHHVTVQRLWPGQISIQIEEQIPVALWNQDAYLNPKGEVFQPPRLSLESRLKQLYGPEQADNSQRLEMMRAMTELSEMFRGFDVVIDQVELDARGAWQVLTGEGIRIVLGEAPFEEKIDRLQRVMSKANAVERSRMQKIDTRYPNGIAVKWKEITVAANLD